MFRKKRVRVWGLAMLLATGCLYQGACLGALRNVNPCGTIFSTAVCDPVIYEQLFGDYYESNFHADPTCVIPYQCGDTAN